MADNTVKLEIFANAQAAEKAIVGLEKKYDDLQNKIRQVARSSKKSSDDAGSGLAAMGKSLLSLAAGYVALPALIGQVVAAQSRLRQSAEQTAEEYDKTFRKFRVQAGLSGLQGDQAKGRILDIAQRIGAREDVAAAAATQMVSSGFSAADATGRGLETVLKTLAASNQLDGNPTELVKAAGQYLAAQGMEKNAGNLEKILVASQRYFKDTDQQVLDLGQLAGKSSGLGKLMSSEEIFASFNMVRQAKNADTASTGLKIFGERLSGAAGDPTREKTLKALKLKAADVDFVGEDLATVLDRLGTAFDNLAPEKRSGLMQRLFGTEGSEAAQLMIDNRAKLNDAFRIGKDVAGFDADVAIGTSGLSAGMQRLRTQQNRIGDAANEGDSLFREAMRGDFMAQGGGRLRAELFAQEFDLLRGFGVSRDWAARLSFGASGKDIASAGAIADQAQSGAKEQTEAIKRTNEILGEIHKDLKGRPARAGQRE